MPDLPRARIYFCVERIHAIDGIYYDIRAIFDTREEAEALTTFCNRNIRFIGGIALCRCAENADLCQFRVVEKERFELPIYVYKGVYYHESVINSVRSFEMLSPENAGHRGYQLSNDGRWWINPISPRSESDYILEGIFEDDPEYDMEWFNTYDKEIVSILN
jgi:hypothetical protein